MSKVKILDCTLRDGGYINDWQFGQDAIRGICERSKNTGANIVELGFLRDELYNKNRAVFSTTGDLQKVINKKDKAVRYAVMAEMASYYPEEKLVFRNENTFDMIRYTFWKRCLDEGYAYCKKIREKGYELAVQPTRVEQYSKEAFAEMIIKFSELEPYAIYIVDTFGLLSKDMLLEYAEIADRYLDKKIVLGYHAHNNMLQALGNAVALTEMGLSREIMLDVSAFGMGRGAGNLNAEVFLHYLNQTYGTKYDIAPIYETWDLWLKDIYEASPWGYSYYYFITAYYKGNPNYATYFMNHGVSVAQADKIMKSIPYEERIIFSEDKVKKYMEINE